MILGENIGSVYSTGRGIKKVYSYGKLVWEWKQNDDIDYSLIPFTVKAIDDAVSVYLKYPFNVRLDLSEALLLKKCPVVSPSINN